MAKPAYTALIRTFNSQRTLALTLDCLAKQTLVPHQHIFVDSGSTDATLDMLPAGSVLHRFVGRDFNYSDALNQGLDYVDTDYVLIISSHTLVTRRAALQYAMDLLESDQKLGAAYFSDEADGGPLRYTSIDKNNFDGRNGLWNSCALIRMELLRRRRFRPEVFAAEDQEWASWLFNEEGGAIAKVLNADTINHNPLRVSFRKLRNDYVAVAYYSKRDRLKWSNILSVFMSGVALRSGLTLRYRRSQIILTCRLIACRWREPKAKSRYF